MCETPEKTRHTLNIWNSLVSMEAISKAYGHIFTVYVYAMPFTFSARKEKPSKTCALGDHTGIWYCWEKSAISLEVLMRHQSISLTIPWYDSEMDWLLEDPLGYGDNLSHYDCLTLLNFTYIDVNSENCWNAKMRTFSSAESARLSASLFFVSSSFI